jgi:PheRS DNA binding domain 3
MVAYEAHEVLSYSLTPEGQQIAEQGSHEARVWAALSEKGGIPVSIKDLKSKVGDESAKVGQGRAFKSGWIVKDGENLYKAVRAFHIIPDSFNIDNSFLNRRQRFTMPPRKI